MRTFASITALLVVTLAMAGCGGGDGCGDVSGGTTGSSTTAKCTAPGGGNGGGGSTTTVPTSLTVTSSTAAIPGDGSSSATIMVLAKDANNNAMPGVAVTLSSSAGTLSGVSATNTASNGTITASLSAAGVAAGTAITLTASSGSVSGKTTVNVVATQQTITLLTSSPQMASSDSAPTTLTAIVQGANNQLLPGVPVSFQVSSGAIVPVRTTAGAAASPTVPAGITDANGQVQATLTTPGNPANRAITVTASVNSTTTTTVKVDVVGTSLTFSGPTSLVQGAAGTYSLSLTDSSSNGISGQLVTLTSANGNMVPATVTTSSTGQATFTLTATNSGNDTVTAAVLGLTATQAVAVSNQNFNITAPADKAAIHVNQAAPIALVWTTGGVAQTGTITFAASRGTLSATSATLAADGTLTPAVTITSSTAGPSIIQASSTGVSAQASVNFVATTPVSLSLQPTPSTIVIKGQSTITATVTDGPSGTGNPVQGATVDFTLTDSTGGALSAPSAVTNAQGEATISYTASTGASTPNGVQIAAQVQGTPGITGSTTLTVGGQTVSLASLGTGKDIIEYSITQYALPYTVQAVDAAGNGIPKVGISFSVKSVAYAMGNHVWVPAHNFWDTVSSSAGTASSDPHAFSVPGQAAYGCQPALVYALNGQITNQTTPPAGAQLTTIPGLVVSTAELGTTVPGITVQQSTTTGDDGTAAVSLLYPKDHAYYVAVTLTATATVQGTQNSTSTVFWLPGASSDFNTQTVQPPGVNSPYGQAAVCY